MQVMFHKPGEPPKSLICINPKVLGCPMDQCRILADRLVATMTLGDSLEKLKKDAQTALRLFMEEFA